MRGLIFGAIVALWAGSAQAQAQECAMTASPVIGLRTGQQWLDMSEVGQHVYVMGFVDGLAAGGFMGTPLNCIKKVSRCVKGKSVRQLAAVVRKQLNENPDWLDKPAIAQMFVALVGSCKL